MSRVVLSVCAALLLVACERAPEAGAPMPDAPAVANDTLTFEVFPSENPAAMLAVHLLHLVDMGMTQGQNFDLETLAEDCAADGRYTFLLAANPEPFVGGVGSPVNPVAVK